MKSKELFFAGHLEEIDDLKQFKRDAPVDLNHENLIILDQVVDALEKKIKTENSKALILITSSKLRSVQTTELIAQRLKSKLGDLFKIRLSMDSNLDAPDQGDFLLPENYKPGDFFEGLKVASKTFIDESLGEKGNLQYRFGDPILQNNGSYKFPELAKYFIKFGETYGESLLRVLNSVIKASEKNNKFKESIEISIIAHGFTFHVLRGLSFLAKKVMEENLQIKPGELAVKLWEIYQQHPASLKTVPFSNIDFSELGNQKLIQILMNEVEFLNKK